MTEAVQGSRPVLVVIRRVVVIAAAVVAVKLIVSWLAARGVLTFSTPLPVVVLGGIVGMTYGLLAVGLVLIYRTNRIINFAHGQIGVFGAAVFGLVAVRYHVPYWLVFPLALAAAGLAGAVAEAAVVRRLRKAPRVVSVVATLGVGQFLVAFASAIYSAVTAGSRFPEPSWLPVFNIGALRITQAYSGMLILSPVLMIVIAGFLRYSRFGLALRASAANPGAARMSGIFAGRMSSLAWAMAGALSAFCAILTEPTQGISNQGAFGPELLLRALTAAVVARMESLPVALTAGIGLGVIEQLILWNYPNSGLTDVVLFVIILLALLTRRRREGRDEEKGSWTSVQAMRPVPETLRRVWLIRHLGGLTATACLALATLLPFVISNSLAVNFTAIIAFSIVGMSVTLLTGLGGQLTLGQFAVAAIGAVASYYVAAHTHEFVLAFIAGGLAAAGVSVLIGLPALRIRGLMLAATTLSFALAAPAWILVQPWMLGAGRVPSPPRVAGLLLDTGKRYYYFALAVLVIAMFIAWNIRRSGFGRLLVAVRDNEANSRAFTVPADTVKLLGYILAGFLAGLGGAVYADSLSLISSTTFPVDGSINVLVMTVIGGLSIISGPVLGALYVLGIPLLPLDSAGIAGTQLGALLLILFLPRGMAGLVEPLRDRLIKRIGRLRGLDIESIYSIVGEVADRASVATGPTTITQISTPSRHTDPGPSHTLLEASNLRKHFGGVVAVADISLQVPAGTTVGLIGPNGAGKTTTFELLGGFTSADGGVVRFDGEDVTRLGPAARAKRGLIRSFQDAALFPTLTVTESVQVGLERNSPTRFSSSVAGLPFADRRKQAQARELLSLLGLDHYRDKQIQELSTGTRRLTEIACLIALEPVLLLLDEPSSGIAQRETEALGELLADLRRQLGLTLLVIEHDIPLIMGISDRIIAMANGRVICEGTPDEVRHDRGVVDAYLGGSIEAVERSGVGRPGSTRSAAASLASDGR